MKVTVYVALPAMFPESKLCAPDGTLVELTVWARGSLLVQVTFPPFAIVTVAGSKLSDWTVPTSLGMDTLAVCGALVDEFDIERALDQPRTCESPTPARPMPAPIAKTIKTGATIRIIKPFEPVPGGAVANSHHPGMVGR